MTTKRVRDEVVNARAASVRAAVAARARYDATAHLTGRYETDYSRRIGAWATAATSHVCRCDDGHTWSTDDDQADERGHARCPTCGAYWV